MYFLNNKTTFEITPWSTGCRMGVVLAGMKTRWILLYISIRSLGWPDALSMSSHKRKESFYLSSRSQVWGSILSKPCCKQMCCYPGFVVLLMEHAQSRFSPILKGPRIFRMVTEPWLYLEVSSSISLKEESWPVLRNFETKHWLLLSSYDSPIWYLFPM